ncbi:unnamed protein product [Leuciscus chuanchicus]
MPPTCMQLSVEMCSSTKSHEDWTVGRERSGQALIRGSEFAPFLPVSQVVSWRKVTQNQFGSTCRHNKHNLVSVSLQTDWAVGFLLTGSPSRNDLMAAPAALKEMPRPLATPDLFFKRGRRKVGVETGSTGVSHPIRKKISTRSKAAFVSRHLEAITARQNSFFLGRSDVLMGPGLGVRSSRVRTHGTGDESLEGSSKLQRPDRICLICGDCERRSREVTTPLKSKPSLGRKRKLQTGSPEEAWRITVGGFNSPALKSCEEEVEEMGVDATRDDVLTLKGRQMQGRRRKRWSLFSSSHANTPATIHFRGNGHSVDERLLARGQKPPQLQIRNRKKCGQQTHCVGTPMALAFAEMVGDVY